MLWTTTGSDRGEINSGSALYREEEGQQAIKDLLASLNSEDESNHYGFTTTLPLVTGDNHGLSNGGGAPAIPAS